MNRNADGGALCFGILTAISDVLQRFWKADYLTCDCGGAFGRGGGEGFIFRVCKRDLTILLFALSRALAQWTSRYGSKCTIKLTVLYNTVLARLRKV